MEEDIRKEIMTLKYEVYYDSLQGGHIKYHRHGEKHRLNGPASFWSAGAMYWYEYGKFQWEDTLIKIYIDNTS